MQVFLSGAMTGLTPDEYNGWRDYIKDALKYDCDVVFSPPDKYNIENQDEYDSEREVMDYDLYQVEKSDVLIVNFDGNPGSIGTAAEIVKAHIIGVPIIGYASRSVWQKIHPWLLECCNKIFIGDDNDDMSRFDDMLYYVKSYYLDVGGRWNK